MSFQPQPPVMGQQPPSFTPPVTPRVTPSFTSPATPPTRGKRRKGLLALGLLLLLGGLGGGAAMVAKSESNYEEAVKSLARAPVGCTTTLVFDKPATFTAYAETKGKLGELGGDCEANGSEYDHSGGNLPRVSMTLLDSNGDEIDLNRGATASYDVGGYVGTGLRTLTIEEAGTYRLNVESDESDFAVAIGKNPKADSEVLKTIGGAVALGGLVLGLTCLLLGLRRRRPDAVLADIRSPSGPMPGWPPGPYAGAAPSPPTGAQQQPPIRLPDRPPATGFAPPSLVLPPPPPTAYMPPPRSAPIPLPPVPPATPTADVDSTPDSDIVWAVEEDPTDDSRGDASR
jgi:hypothetical protein